MKKADAAFKKLAIVVFICFLFMIVEIAGGIISNSLAILTDAAHMLSDVGGMGISMISIWIGKKNATAKNSFGFHRAEVLGALTSIIIIWLMVVWLSWEATFRMFFLDTIKIEAPIMLITAFISLACNIFNLVVLGHMPLPCLKG
jgi:zinc transporter 2